MWCDDDDHHHHDRDHDYDLEDDDALDEKPTCRVKFQDQNCACFASIRCALNKSFRFGPNTRLWTIDGEYGENEDIETLRMEWVSKMNPPP